MNIQRDLIDRWQKRDEEKGIGKINGAAYRRHARVFTDLIAACGGDATRAQRVVDAFFDDDHPALKQYGWDIGTFQKRYRAYIVKVKEADERAARNARRWKEEQVEREERTTPVPKAMPPEALAKTEALKRRMMGGA